MPPVPLTDTAVKNAKPRGKPYKLADGGGLYLLVSLTGARLWRYKYRIAGNEGTFAIGGYPEISLNDAREIHSKARELARQGIHPLHHRNTEKLKIENEAGNTFKAIAEDWISKNKNGWSGYYLRQIERFMASDVYPQIGTLPIKQVTAAHILQIIKKAEGRGAETVAILIRQWCSQVFRYAVANLQADVDPTYALKGAVVRPKIQHNRPLSAKQIPSFKESLRKYGGYRTTAIAIELLLKGALIYWDKSFDPQAAGHGMAKLTRIVKNKARNAKGLTIPTYFYYQQRYITVSRYPTNGKGFVIPGSFVEDLDRVFADLVLLVPFQHNTEFKRALSGRDRSALMALRHKNQQLRRLRMALQVQLR